jgi:hypothetical protein
MVGRCVGKHEQVCLYPFGKHGRGKRSVGSGNQSLIDKQRATGIKSPPSGT